MEVASVDVTTVEVERKFGFGTSTCTLIELTTDTGESGVGEIPDIEDPEAAPSDTEIEAEIESFLSGRDPRQIQLLTDEMYDAVSFGKFEFHSFQQLALGAIDTALYDLVGTHLNTPVHQLLGGRSHDVPITWVVFTRGGEDELTELRAEVQEKVEEGFTAFKLKVGEREPSVDLARIEAVRDIAGDDATVLLDAQGLWSKSEAISTIRKFEQAGIDGVETPVGHPDKQADAPGYYYDIPLFPDDIAEVRAAVDTALIEHVLDPAFGLELIQADAVDVFTVEVCSGGITRAKRILDIAASAGVDARLGSTVELGPGSAAATALATASTAVTYPCDLIGPALYKGAVLSNRIEYQDGCLSARDAPGFGIDVNWELLSP
ncbi:MULTISPECIES: mandelate racemase/muconate lactonizing enzyme family protein [unclassified Haladaptatus]|uniref:mandelate racemase/muconate lactonizing enzyme family protein n=1 Tax=unclassified Haladaptatus TaxID=2622732 RepID=UPI0023E8136B|nr:MULTISPECIES: enolase C-terminal domain-like protein [unclassified Haladaptatus]